MKKIIISAIAVGFMASSAFAGGKFIERVHSDPKPVFSCGGAFAGLQAGLVSSKAKITDGARVFELKPSGLAGGIFAGYDICLNNSFFIGIEGDINGVSADDKKDFMLMADYEGDKYKIKEKWNASLRLRVGTILNGGDTNLYLTGGAAWTNVELSKTSMISGMIVPASSGKAKKTLTGWTAGAGAEFKLSGNWSARLQYRYSKYSKKTFNIGGSPINVNYNSHLVQVGVKYTF